MKIIGKTIVSLIFLFLFFLLTRSLVNYQTKFSFYKQIENNYQQKKKENINLKTGILRAKEKTNLEKTIRNKLGFLKKNEIAIIIPKITPSPTIITPPPLPNWQQWLRVFNLD